MVRMLGYLMNVRTHFQAFSTPSLVRVCKRGRISTFQVRIDLKGDSPNIVKTRYARYGG